MALYIEGIRPCDAELGLELAALCIAQRQLVRLRDGCGLRDRGVVLVDELVLLDLLCAQGHSGTQICGRGAAANEQRFPTAKSATAQRYRQTAAYV